MSPNIPDASISGMQNIKQSPDLTRALGWLRLTSADDWLC